jgi:hypothetical protein
MDLQDLNITKKANDGVWVTLKHPFTREELPVKVLVAGIFSEAYYKAKDAIESAMIADIGNADKDNKQRSYELKLVADCILDFEGLEENGRKLTKADAPSVIEKHRWIFEQINLEIANRSNFI